jgi:glycosyltransferase involved in cell wall biosynthesis
VKTLRVLFVHHRYPGQWVHWAAYLNRLASVDVRFLTASNARNDSLSGTAVDHIVRYEEAKLSEEALGHPLRRTMEATANAYNCLLASQRIKSSGWEPDVVYSHSGWAPAMFLREIFPKAKYIKYAEWYYNPIGSDSDFLSSYSAVEESLGVRLLNFPLLTDLSDADALISPTKWQRDQFPSFLRQSIEIVPDGIDTDFFAPDPEATLTLDNGKVLSKSDRIVTYATRGADSYRGFRQFIEMLECLQASDRSVQAVIAGDRLVYYGPGAGTTKHYDEVLAGAKLDFSRTHFLGFASLERYRCLLQISSVHIYLTVPFVLSWSLMEAMSVGCHIVASDTQPVKEFVQDGISGYLVNFFNVDELRERTLLSLDRRDSEKHIGENARKSIGNRWSLIHAVETQKSVLRRTAGAVL